MEELHIVDEEGNIISSIKSISISSEDIEEGCRPYPSFIDNGEVSVDVKVQRISRKRFIKLLMGQGYSRNMSYKMHSVYKGMYGSRTYIGLMCFLTYLQGMKELGEELYMI